VYDSTAWSEYGIQASAAFDALLHRGEGFSRKVGRSEALDTAWVEVLRALLRTAEWKSPNLMRAGLPGRPSPDAWPKCAPLIEQLNKRKGMKGIKQWFDRVKQEYSAGPMKQTQTRKRKSQRKRKKGAHPMPAESKISPAFQSFFTEVAPNEKREAIVIY